jgi:uncharacterized protein YdeI (YjbR/CyaY-like superfamily)
MESVQVKTIAELESWLDEYHDKSGSVWLVYPKPISGLGDLTYSSLVDVLLCYGWIDSLPRKVDSKRTSIRISPRNPKSNWSGVNKEKITRLKKAGRLRPAGERLVALAKQIGTWDALNDVENLMVPPDLAKALQPRVLTTAWETKSRSWRRGVLEQLVNAKQPATRAKRIVAILESLRPS